LSKKSYNISWSEALAPGAGFTQNFTLLSAGREIFVKSVLITTQFTRAVTPKVIPTKNNTSVLWNLYLIGIDTLPFQLNGGTVPVNNGKNLQIFETGQYFFDSFSNKNSIDLFLSCNNGDPLAITADFTIQIETMEEIIR